MRAMASMAPGNVLVAAPIASSPGPMLIESVQGGFDSNRHRYTLTRGTPANIHPLGAQSEMPVADGEWCPNVCGNGARLPRGNHGARSRVEGPMLQGRDRDSTHWRAMKSACRIAVAEPTAPQHGPVRGALDPAVIRGGTEHGQSAGRRIAT